MSERTNTSETPGSEVKTRVLILRKVGEIARREAHVAFPAAKRAASHAAQAFIKKFSEEYAQERKKRQGPPDRID